MTTYLPFSDTPQRINVADITHIKAYEDFVLIMGKDGELYNGSYAAFDSLPDGQSLVDYMAAAGHPLLPIQITDPNNNYKVHNTEYVAPEAISFITVSKTSTDGLQGIIVNARGGWRIETSLPPPEIKRIVDAFKSAKPDLLTFLPEEASARWVHPDALYIDASAITRLHSDNFQLLVQFYNTGRDLDIKVGKEGKSRRNDRGPDLNALAEKIFQSTTGLTKLDGPRDFCAVQKENIQIVDTDDIEPGSYSHTFYMRLIDKQTTMNPYPNAFNLYFKTAEERARSIQQLGPQKPFPEKSWTGHKP